MIFFLSFLFVAGFLYDFGTVPWLSFHREIFSFLFLIVSTIYAAKKDREILIPLSFPFFIFFIFFIFLSIQAIFGFYEKNGTVIVVGLYAIYCVFLISLSRAKRAFQDLSLFLSCNLIFISLVSSLFCIIQLLGVYNDFYFVARYEGFRRPGANLGQANHVGTIMVMGVASLLYICGKLKINRVILSLLTFVLVLGAVTTESRTCLLSTLVLIVVNFIPGNLRFLDKRVLVLLVFSLIFILMPVFPNFVSFYYDPNFKGNINLINSTSSMRLEMWGQVLQAVNLKPIFGWGFLGTSQALNAVQHNYQATLPFTYSHNIVLDFLVAFGWPVSIFIFIFFLIWLYKKLRFLRGLSNIEYIYAITLLLVFLVHSLLEYPFAYSYMLLPVMISVGILERDCQKVFRINGWQLYFSIILSVLVIAVIVRDYINVENDYRVIIFENLNFRNNYNEVKVEDSILLNQLKPLLISLRDQRNNIQVPDFDSFKYSALNYPRYQTQMKYIYALKELGDFEEACRQLFIFNRMHVKNIYKSNGIVLNDDCVDK